MPFASLMTASRTLLLSLGLGLSAPALAWEKNDGLPLAGEPHYDIEVLYGEGKYTEGLAAAEAKLSANPKDVDLHWMVVRYMFEVAEAFGEEEATFDKEAHYEKMITIADKGLALDPGHPHLLFGRGIARGRLGTTRGVLSSLFMAEDIEDDWTTALNSGYEYESLDGHEIMPCDVAQALGIFYRLVPEWWIVGVIAGTKGDLDKSVQLLEFADKCRGQRIHVVKELGVSRICRGQKRNQPSQVNQGLADLKRALDITPKTNSDHTDHRHIKMLIGDLDLACEYSRDGQADLDRSKLDSSGVSAD